MNAAKGGMTGRRDKTSSLILAGRRPATDRAKGGGGGFLMSWCVGGGSQPQAQRDV